MSAMFIGAGIFLITSFGIYAVWEIMKTVRSDSTAKLEKSLTWMTLFFAGAMVSGFAILAGWNMSYPTHMVDGKPRSEAPSSYTWLAIVLLFLVVACAVMCTILGYCLKKRRLAPLKNERDRIRKALVSEYGSAEQVNMIMNRTGLNDQLRDAEREGF